jgi:hypothetical protein
MVQQKSEFDKQMQYLEAEIRRLEAEFNMFFAGRLPRPPWETRAKVAALVKKHDQSFIRNTADRFRFESLQNRHQKFLELWDRQMTNRELGRTPTGARKPMPTPAPSPSEAPAESRRSAEASGGAKADIPAQESARATAEARAHEAAERVVKFGRNDDAAARAKEVYEQLAAAKKQVGEAPVSFDRVEALVRAQVQKFGAEGNVAFKIGMKDGKVSLTVKAEKENE